MPTRVFATVFLTVLLSGSLVGHQTDGRKVMEQVRDQSRLYKNQQADVILTIEDKRKRERVRYFRSVSKIYDDYTATLIKFTSPPTIRGTGMLNEVRDADGVTNQWLYLPAVRSVKKLGRRDSQNSFMGSDFSNADVAGRRVDEDRHTIVDQNDRFVVVRSVPIDPEDPYGSIETHVIRAYLLPYKVIFYDQDGEQLKILHSRKIKKIGKMYTIMKAEMVNHKTGGRSILEKENIDNKSFIEDRDVSIQAIKN